MTETDARDTIAAMVNRRSLDLLDAFARLILAENRQQNLISRSSESSLWTRHILDSAQLVPLAGRREGSWVDVGTGGGFPGIVVATMWRGPVFLVEPRAKRAAFLKGAVDALRLDNVSVVASPVEKIAGICAGVVSARAVASIETLFAAARHIVSSETRWVLPRGSRWQSDIEAARIAWTGMFHVEQSLTETEARIVIASQVEQR